METEAARQKRRKAALILLGLLLMAGLACPSPERGRPGPSGATELTLEFPSVQVLAAGDWTSAFRNLAPPAMGLLAVLAAAIPLPRFARGGILLALALAFWVTLSIAAKGRMWFSLGGETGWMRLAIIAVAQLAFFGWVAVLAGARVRRYAPASRTAWFLGAAGACLYLVTVCLPVVSWTDSDGPTRTSTLMQTFQLIKLVLQGKGPRHFIGLADALFSAAFVLGILAAGVINLFNTPGRSRPSLPARAASWLAALAPFCLTAAVSVTVARFYQMSDTIYPFLDFLKGAMTIDLPLLLLPLAAADLLLAIPAIAGPAAAAPPPLPPMTPAPAGTHEDTAA